MDFILEYRIFYKSGDIVLIHYWYNRDVLPVKILEKVKNKYLVSYDIPQCELQNAPNQLIKGSDIISIFRN